MVIKDLTVEEMAGLTSLEFDILCDRVWRRIRKELRQGSRREALPPGETDSGTTVLMVHSISASIAEGGRHVALHGDALMDGKSFSIQALLIAWCRKKSQRLQDDLLSHAVTLLRRQTE